MAKQVLKRDRHHLDFVIRHSPASPKPSPGGSLQSALIATDARLTELVKNIDVADRVALDTEADSLHSYREKLCLLQISVPAAVSARGYNDFIGSAGWSRSGATAPGAGTQGNCSAWRRLRSADVTARLEFHRVYDLRYADCGASPWHSRI